MNKVLIADNDCLMRQAMRTLIMKVPGFDFVYEVDNGQAAVEICEKEDISLVFMDIRMPIKNGMDAIREIRAKKPKVTICIVTSSNSFEMAQFAVQNSIERYIIKPVVPSEIYHLLNDFLIHVQSREEVPTNLVGELSLHEAIFSGNYTGAQCEVNKLINELFFTVRTEQREHVLTDMLLRLFDGRLGVNQWHYKEFCRKYPFDERYGWCQGLCEVWINQCVDLIFQYISSEKYCILAGIFEYIDAHVYEELSLHRIVKECNVSQGYLSRIIKKVLGITLMTYIHVKKISLAKQYLLEKNISGRELSFLLGYNDFGYFCKVFKKYEMMTVSAYKNRARNS